jgi:hypothetical protein
MPMKALCNVSRHALAIAAGAGEQWRQSVAEMIHSAGRHRCMGENARDRNTLRQPANVDAVDNTATSASSSNGGGYEQTHRWLRSRR